MSDKIFTYILPALNETVIMLLPSIIISTLLGLIFATTLYLINSVEKYQNKPLYAIINWFINIFRSIPFLILIIVLFPISLLLVGTTIGPVAAIIPLSIAATPFSTRLFEAAFETIDKNLVVVSISYGANVWQIIFKVLLPEAKISLIRLITTVFINLLGFSSIAGTIGAGGIGDLVIKFGYQRFDIEILIISLIILILIVQIVQSTSNIIVKRLANKYKI